MTTDFRALCAELVDELNGLSAHVEATTPFETVLSGIRAYNRARAALAEPKSEGPTVMEIIELADQIEESGLGQVDLVRAALARWGRSDGPAVPDGREPASVNTSLALRVQRLEALRETEKAALLDAFRQIDELKQRIDFQYFKLHRIEDALSTTAQMTDD